MANFIAEAVVDYIQINLMQLPNNPRWTCMICVTSFHKYVDLRLQFLHPLFMSDSSRCNPPHLSVILGTMWHSTEVMNCRWSQPWTRKYMWHMMGMPIRGFPVQAAEKGGRNLCWMLKNDDLALPLVSVRDRCGSRNVSYGFRSARNRCYSNF